MGIRRYIIISVLFFCNAINVFSTQTVEDRCKVHGVVLDNRTTNPIKKFTIIVLPFDIKVKTDKQGQFLLNVPVGKISLVFDDYGFEKRELSLELRSDTNLTISLNSPFNVRYIEEVEVVSNNSIRDKPVSVDCLDKQTLKKMPSFLGEKDIVKAISVVSGVSASSEGGADMQIHGGTHGQNLYLFNEVPLYHTQHALGLISVFNPTIVQSAELYKADFPAKYGGKISSILAVNTLDPTLKKLNGEFESGLLSTKAMLNFPIIRDKLGMFISGRISNFTPILELANTLYDDEETQLGIAFSDINAGLKYRLGDFDYLYMNFFNLADKWNITQIDYSDNTKLIKNNVQQNISLIWDHRQKEKIMNKLVLFADCFTSSQSIMTKTKLNNASEKIDEQGFNSSIKSIKLDETMTWKLKPSLMFSFGAAYQQYFIRPLEFSGTDIFNKRLISVGEGSLFVQSDFDLGINKRLKIGMRAVNMDWKMPHVMLEPRISMNVRLPLDYSVECSIDRMSQHIHRVANSGLGLPMEVFVPSGLKLSPETSWTYSIGASKEVIKPNFLFSIKSGLWYKLMNNIVEFEDGFDAYSMLVSGQNVYDDTQKIVVSGNGKAYGFDLTTSVDYKKTDISVSYTLMRSYNQFDELNEGKPFDATTDIRHSLFLTVSQKLTKTIVLTANWQYNSGKPITVPTQVISSPDVDWENNAVSFPSVRPDNYTFIYGERNNYRTRAFNKLDISITKDFTLCGKQSAFSFGIYNVFNRKNPFLHFVSSKEVGNNYVPVLKSISIFPILPLFNINVRY